jgi:hypothetical protein
MPSSLANAREFTVVPPIIQPITGKEQFMRIRLNTLTAILRRGFPEPHPKECVCVVCDTEKWLEKTA